MFDLNQIKEAHSKVKSGEDFPNYIRDLKNLGVTMYHTYVSDGHTVFFGEGTHRIQSEPKYPNLTIADRSDNQKFIQYLRYHQEGQSDYLGFCRHSAETGVEKWTVDMEKMTCTYYDKANNKMFEEKIPSH